MVKRAKAHKMAPGGAHTTHGNTRPSVSAHDVAMQDLPHTQLSTNSQIMDHPARTLPPPPAGWGSALDNNNVIGPESE